MTFPSSEMMPSPQTTLFILLGASEWPFANLESSTAFAQSAKKVKDYFCRPHQFGLPPENWLDLFDKQQSSPEEVDQAISTFLDDRTSLMKQKGVPARDLLFYYIGHGVFAPGQELGYHLAIRSTRDESLRSSAVSMAALAETLKRKARYLRRIVILDCCFAAESFKYMMQAAPDQVAIQQATSAFAEKSTGSGLSRKGTSLLCSSEHTEPSLLLRDKSGTMFSEAFIRALVTGDKYTNKSLIPLYDLKNLIEDALESLTDGDAPMPFVGSPDKSGGDVASIPFFPNAHVGKEKGNLQQKGDNIEQPIELTSHEASVGTMRIVKTESRETCSICHGTRNIQGKVCVSCKGQGTISGSRQIEVKIPAGVRNGTRIRITGKGRFSIYGGERGDLFLVITIKSDLTSKAQQRNWQIKPDPMQNAPIVGRTLFERTLDDMGKIGALAWSPDGLHVAIATVKETIEYYQSKTLDTGQVLKDRFIWQKKDSFPTTYVTESRTKQEPFLHLWSLMESTLSSHNAPNIMSHLLWLDETHVASYFSLGMIQVPQVWKVRNGGLVFDATREVALSFQEKAIKALNEPTRLFYVGQIPDKMISPDQAYILSREGGKIYIWEYNAEVHKDRRYDRENAFRVYDKHLPSGRFKRMFTSAPGAIWSPDGEYVAVLVNKKNMDISIDIWKVQDNTFVSCVSQSPIKSLSWAPDGARLATSAGAGDSTIQIWDRESGQELLTYAPYSSSVRTFSWSHSGRYIASSYWNPVHVWESTTGKTIAQYDKHAGPVEQISWAPDDRKIATAFDNHVHIWS